MHNHTEKCIQCIHMYPHACAHPHTHMGKRMQTHTHTHMYTNVCIHTVIQTHFHLANQYLVRQVRAWLLRSAAEEKLCEHRMHLKLILKHNQVTTSCVHVCELVGEWVCVCVCLCVCACKLVDEWACVCCVYVCMYMHACVFVWVCACVCVCIVQVQIWFFF